MNSAVGRAMRLRMLAAFGASCVFATSCDRVGVDARDEHGMTALMYAAQRGDSAEVERLVSRGTSVRTAVPTRDVRELVAFLSWMQQLPASDIGYTALHYAAAGKHAAVAKRLLALGADANHAARGGTTPLDLAVFRADTAMMAVLVTSGARVGPQQLWRAVRLASPATVALLLSYGADPNTPPERDARGTTPPAPPLAIMAAQRADSTILRLVIAAKADVNARDQNGWTALRHARRAASRNRQRDVSHVIAMLEAAGAQDEAGRLADALMDAIYRKDAAAARAALSSGANANDRDDRGVPPIVAAARRGQSEIVAALIAAKANVGVSPQNDATPLISAVESGSAETVKLLLDAGANVNERDKLRRTPLQVAGNFRQTEISALLLKAGATVDSTALPAATLAGGAEMVRVLLAAGANPNAARGWALSEATRGCLRNDNTEVIRVLLNAGADPKVHGDSPHLHRAAALCDTVVVRLFLNKGADPNARDLSGNTALMSAVGSGRLDALRMLIAAHADVNAKNDEGKSVLSFATRFPEIQAELRRAGAR